jgi:DNA-binding PadR family transcriptional regulator
MRRKQDQLLPLEVEILRGALRLRRRGAESFHGYALAKALRSDSDSKLLTAHGTLYRALHRLESAGLIEAFWEDAQSSERENRPRRRMYRLTGLAEPAVKRAADARAVAGLRALKPNGEMP